MSDDRPTLRDLMKMLFIKKVGTEGLLEQVIEESSELIKAVSKYERICKSYQPTELHEDAAREDILEEIADIELVIEEYLDLLEKNGDIKVRKRIETIQKYKMLRAVKRFAERDINDQMES